VSEPSRAAERTALAWNRTGLAFVVSGAIVIRLLAPDGRGAVGLVMLAIGTVTAAYGWRFRSAVAHGRAVQLLALATTALAVAVFVAAAVPA
jgi:uncharacterized membrane protein YidH (DUF202 family)